MGFLDWLRGRRTAEEEEEPEDAEPRRHRITKIRREVMEMVFESAKSSHPQEFAAVLRAEGDTITEILLVPAIQGDAHAIMFLSSLPIDRTAVGTVHSHPSPVALPSHADQQLFRNFGHTHIIVAWPYDARSWRAYDHESQDIELDVVG